MRPAAVSVRTLADTGGTSAAAGAALVAASAVGLRALRSRPAGSGTDDGRDHS